MIEAEIFYGDIKLEEVNFIRKQVNNSNCFDDCKDLDSYHVIIYENKEPVATGRLHIEKNFILEKVFVLLSKRNNYYGDLVVKMLLDKAFTLLAKEIITYATKVSVGFFETIGFHKDENQDDSPNELIKMTITKAAIKKCSP